MPDLSAVLREAFPLGAAGPTVRRWWPLVLTGAVAALSGWAATATWFGLTIGRVGVPFGFTGTGRAVVTGPESEGGPARGATTDGVLPWGYATAGLAIAALILVIVATVRPSFAARGRALASGLLGLAAVLSILVWIFPAMMMSGLEDLTGGDAGGDPLFFPPKGGLVSTIVVTSTGASVLFMGRRNRPLSAARAAPR
ncbi:hypothetical protein [Tsukamurella ocularis]|uniref:hypothetical protein n=1 Tax=Tsukamurella ocularis TaxID=1970234 RepID=UPI0021698079|nr:hypothetical protein [Tsukamurella ocularis]MCS3779561.1 hypothetical protein [Tsukamurella ocularis]MCS3789039.1 hypothetical protein [Tsukamurella ocularis]MCS3850249.1 hypothetical protein [Tsukamurella ocularis]